MKVAAPDYRERLRDAYVSTHFGAIRNASIGGIEDDFPVFRTHLLPHVGPDRSKAILDLGCGYGALLYTLRRHGYRNVTGVDASPEQVELALRLGIAGVRKEEAVTHLRNALAAYDVVLAIDFLEHLPKPDLLEVIDAVAHSLRPKGKFVIQTLNAASPFAGLRRYGDLTHALAFTATSIAQVLRNAGFTSVCVREMGPAVHGAKSAARWLLWQSIRPMLSLYLLAETGSSGARVYTQNLIAVASGSAR